MFETKIVLILILFLLSCVSSYYAIKFALLLLRLEDIIEESIDEIDESYQKMTKILQKPIFFDSIEVRDCVNEIKKLRNLMFNITDRLASISNSAITINETGEKIEQIKGSEENTQQ